MTAINNDAAAYVTALCDGLKAEGIRIGKALESLDSRLMKLAFDAGTAAAKSGPLSEARYNAEVAPYITKAVEAHPSVKVYLTQIKTVIIGAAAGIAREKKGKENLRTYYARVSPLLKAKGLLAPTKRDAGKTGKPNAGAPVNPAQGKAASAQDTGAAKAAQQAGAANPVKVLNMADFTGQIALAARMSESMAKEAAALIVQHPASFAAWLKAEKAKAAKVAAGVTAKVGGKPDTRRTKG